MNAIQGATRDAAGIAGSLSQGIQSLYPKSDIIFIAKDANRRTRPRFNADEIGILRQKAFHLSIKRRNGLAQGAANARGQHAV